MEPSDTRPAPSPAMEPTRGATVSRRRAWWLAIRPRTLPAAVGPVLAGARGRRRGGRLRGAAGPGMPGRGAPAAGRLEPGQRPVRLPVRRGRRGPCRAAPRGGTRAPRAARAGHRHRGRPRPGRARGAVPGDHRGLAHPGARPAGHRQRGGLHGRSLAVRLPRARRGLRLRLLRSRRRRRHCVPPDAGPRAAGAGRLRPGRRPHHRHPGRQQPARHRARPEGRQADARRPTRGGRRRPRVRPAPGRGIPHARGAAPGRRRVAGAAAPARRHRWRFPSWPRSAAGGDPRRLNATLAGTARLSLVFAALLAIGLALPGLAPSWLV